MAAPEYRQQRGEATRPDRPRVITDAQDRFIRTTHLSQDITLLFKSYLSNLFMEKKMRNFFLIKRRITAQTVRHRLHAAGLTLPSISAPRGSVMGYVPQSLPPGALSWVMNAMEIHSTVRAQGVVLMVCGLSLRWKQVVGFYLCKSTIGVERLTMIIYKALRKLREIGRPKAVIK